MDGDLLSALLYALLPIAAVFGGGASAAFRPPGPKVRSTIQHFAAGVVFAVVAVELLPYLRKQHLPWEVALSFSLGVAVMLVIRRMLGEEKEENQESPGLPWGMLIAVGFDLLLDGFLLGIGFAAGARAGVVLTLGLAAECLSLGLATSATLVRGGMQRRGRAILVTMILGLVFGLGAVLGLTLLRGLSGRMLTSVISFGCAALLYLVTEELLVEAHEVEETNVATAAFFVGFLIILVLGMTGGD
jgi:ZIP family zinc transporter